MKQHFINGRWTPGASGETLPVIDPSTGEVSRRSRAARPPTSMPRCRRRAPPSNRCLGQARADRAGPPAEPSSRTLVAANHDEARPDRVAGHRQADGAGAHRRHACSRATSSSTAAPPTSCTATTIPFHAGYTCNVLREPHGVTGHIMPWNYPLQIFGRSSAPALAAGNACVRQAGGGRVPVAVAARRTRERGGLARRRHQHRHRPGRARRARRSPAHPGIDHCPFTGSPATGALVARRPPQRHCPVHARARRQVAAGRVRRRRSRCGGAGDRQRDRRRTPGRPAPPAAALLVERSRYEELVDGCAAAVREGSGSARREMDLDCGPLIRAAAIERVRWIPRAMRAATGIRCWREGRDRRGAAAAAATTSTPMLFGAVPRSHTARARGGVRPGAGGDAVRRRGRCGRARQRHRLRTGRGRLDARRRAADAHGAGDPGRPGIHQQLRRGRRCRAAVRRRRRRAATAARKASRRSTDSPP